MATQKDPYAALRMFSSGLNVALVTASIWAASAVEELVASLTVDKPFLATTLTYFGIATIVWVLTTFILAPILLGLRFVRRLVLWNSYVEGTWIESVQLADGATGTAIITIAPDGEDFALYGTTYGDDGNPSSSFVADYHQIHWPILKYKHSNWPYGGKEGEGVLEGMAQLNFESSPKGPPVYYAGFFHHVGSSIRSRTQANKVRRSELKKLNSVQGKQELIRAYRDRLRVRIDPTDAAAPSS